VDSSEKGSNDGRSGMPGGNRWSTAKTASAPASAARLAASIGVET
jgi:hypothetical protein